jgi:hypothetical protein
MKHYYLFLNLYNIEIQKEMHLPWEIVFQINFIWKFPKKGLKLYLITPIATLVCCHWWSFV